MINTKFLISLFTTYKINKVILLEDKDTYNFIVSDMDRNLNLENWEYLENILKDVTEKDINILTYNQAIKHFDVSKGVVIK